MPLQIHNEKVNALATALAERLGVTKTEAVRLALENELREFDKKMPLRERLKQLQDEIAARPNTGLKADKAFFDELSGEDERDCS